MLKIIPLFKSHYSIGRSILTLEKESVANGPDSVISLAKETSSDKAFLVEDSMTGFLEGFKNLKNEGIHLAFGLRLTICPDITDKSEESLGKSSKYILFAKNLNGYKRLIKISSTASIKGFYYEPRIDFKTLKALWDEKDLNLCVPFYDSFIFKNVLGSSMCVPDFSSIRPTFFCESNNLPFDSIIEKKVKEYCSKNDFEFVAAKSIFYKNKSDFKSYLTFRCINERTTLNKPELSHMCSDEFSFESWKEANSK